MKCELADICYYYKEKIDVSLLNDKNYISTENMLPNKAGITISSSLPTSKTTQKYEKDDILVSNIRPYFKKFGKQVLAVVVLMMYLYLEQKKI